MARAADEAHGLRIIAEPGLTATIVEKSADEIRDVLEANTLEYAGLTVADESSLELDPKANLEAVRSAETLGPEAVVFLTEIPRFAERGTSPPDVVLIEVDAARESAVISGPAFGPFPRRGLIDAIGLAARRLEGRREPPPGGRQWSTDPTAGTDRLLAGGRIGRMRLASGMVRANRPWRLIPTLTGMTAAAAAASSFGVFFTSIWSMADALSVWRLLGISVLSLVLATVWLVVNNRLWDTPRRTSVRRARLYNIATVVTVAFSVSVLYLGLFIATLLAALIVIDSGFMTQTLGAPVDAWNYLSLAWLATSLGMFAGAIGSSADSYDDVLRATYGYRERTRRKAQRARCG
ncbi:hypothetical protein [Gordonia polyisoprenivorans]|uniref:hypothetical protein n=1 Tax=Gordonia polyisoprenivorans TaxID=84595 RepID=UPI001F0B3E15|nr:hypothetical protein [Gordonia polyisoprenivorans]